MTRIWGQFDLNFIFSFFYKFGTLGCILVQFASSVRVEKHMVVILTFLAFFWCILSHF